MAFASMRAQDVVSWSAVVGVVGAAIILFAAGSRGTTFKCEPLQGIAQKVQVNVITNPFFGRALSLARGTERVNFTLVDEGDDHYTASDQLKPLFPQEADAETRIVLDRLTGDLSRQRPLYAKGTPVAGPSGALCAVINIPADECASFTKGTFGRVEVRFQCHRDGPTFWTEYLFGGR